MAYCCTKVLQWHHLLSLVPGQNIQRLTTQILADGLFHVLMYIVGLKGGAWLWRRREALAETGGSRPLRKGLLIGFGAWNVVDVVVFHWILEIHHIRLDVAQPLAWDVSWLLGLGLAPIAAGAWQRTGRGRGRIGPSIRIGERSGAGSLRRMGSPFSAGRRRDTRGVPA